MRRLRSAIFGSARVTSVNYPRAAIATAMVALLSMVSSLALLGYLEAAPESVPPIQAFRSLIFPANPQGKVAAYAPSLFDFSEANALLGWAIATGVVASFCLCALVSMRRRASSSRTLAIGAIASLLTLVCLVVLWPTLLSVYRAAYVLNGRH